MDPAFNGPGMLPARLSFMADNQTAGYYLRHFFKIIPEIGPIGIASFRGRLNTERLNLFYRMIIRFAKFALPGIQDGDSLNSVAKKFRSEGID